MAKILAFFAAAFILTNCLPPAQTRVVLNVPALHQSTNFTCWASSLAMIGSYIKQTHLSECEVVRAVNIFYRIDVDCCMAISPLCQRGGSITDILLGLDNVFKINYRYEARALTFDEIKTSIDAGRPIIALRAYLQGGAHAHVIVGYDAKTKEILVNEPTFGQLVSEPYDRFIGTLYSGIWMGSVVITSTPASKQMCTWKCHPNDGCHTLVCDWNPGESRPLPSRSHFN